MGFENNARTASGYKAVPESGNGKGVLLLHAWWGLNNFFVDVCDRLAHEGFVVLAPDLYDGKIAETIAEAEALSDTLDEAATQEKILSALAALQSAPGVSEHNIGVIGFSLGAAWALLLSVLRPDDIAAVVVYYGTYSVDFAAARAAYLGHFAENDDWEPIKGVHQMQAEMSAAKRPVEFHIYKGVGHWFVEKNRPDAFNADTAEKSWAFTVSFLRENLAARA